MVFKAVRSNALLPAPSGCSTPACSLACSPAVEMGQKPLTVMFWGPTQCPPGAVRREGGRGRQRDPPAGDPGAAGTAVGLRCVVTLLPVLKPQSFWLSVQESFRFDLISELQKSCYSTANKSCLPIY